MIPPRETSAKFGHEVCESVRGGFRRAVRAGETGAPATAGSSGQRACSRSRRGFYIFPVPLRPGHTPIRQKPPGISHARAERWEWEVGVSMIAFDEFWNAYPRKVGRLQAERCWNRMADRDRELAMQSLELWKLAIQWQSGDGLYIPYGSTFLNQERYRDEPWTGAFEEAGIDSKKTQL